MAVMTSADILKINNAEELAEVIDEVIAAYPELGYFGASPITKNSYKTLAITGHPSVSFRVPGTDRVYSTGTLVNKEIALKYLDASWILEKAIAEQSDRGAAFACALQQRISLAAAMAKICQQIWYGNALIDGGFNGLYLQVSALGAEKNINVNQDRSFMDGTSVFFVRTGLDSLQLAWGNNGKLVEGEIRDQERGSTGDNPQGRWHYVQELAGWVGLQNVNKHSCVKISGLSAASGAQGLNDTLLYQALELFPSGFAPTAIFMNRRSLGQLRRSRNAYNATGLPAPLPTEFEGIPIFVTDAISNEESYTLISNDDSGSGSGGGDDTPATPTQLDAPTLTATAASDTSITLAIGAVTNASSYKMRTASSEVGLASASGNTITQSADGTAVVGLTASTEYWYQVQAVGDGTTYSDSDWSTAAHATTNAAAGS